MRNLLWQKRPDSADDCQDSAHHDEEPTKESLFPADLLAKHIQVESTREDDADAEAEERAHQSHDSVERGAHDRENKDD